MTNIVSFRNFLSKFLMLFRRKIGWQYYGQRINAISPLVPLRNMLMQAIGFVFFCFLISPNKRPRPHMAVFVWKQRFSFLRFQGHPTSIFGKISVRKMIWDRIFQHLKNGIIGSLFSGWNFRKVSFDPYNFRMTGLSARRSEQMKNF